MLRQISMLLVIITVSVITTVITVRVITTFENGDKQETKKEDLTLKPLDFIIDWQPEPTYLGIYYALDSKEFEKAGYDVTIQTSWGAHQAVAAIAAGKYIIGTASGGATVLARSNGIPIKSLGVLYQDIPTVIYGIASKSMAKMPKDIEGMRIGIYPGSITNDEFNAFIQANNLDTDKITKVSLSGGDIPILMSEEIDGVLHYNEMSPVVVDVDNSFPEVNGKRTWRLHLKDLGVKSYGLNIITSDKAFSENATELQKLTQAVYNGYTSACNNKEDAVDKFIERFPDKNKAYIAKGFELVCDQLTNPVGTQNKIGWQESINLFESLGLLKNPVTAEEIIIQ
jgi:ABC-type nitrate/sulfonate/bicarbonate transport system substrate-binding protein